MCVYNCIQRSSDREPSRGGGERRGGGPGNYREVAEEVARHKTMVMKISKLNNFVIP